MSDTISFTLNGVAIDALPNETILKAAQRVGIKIPYLCQRDGLRDDSNCRACMIEIEGERVLVPACTRKPQPGQRVSSNSMRATAAQRGVLELLAADTDEQTINGSNELTYWIDQLKANVEHYRGSREIEKDHSQPGISVDLNACIHCGRCVRACREIQVNGVIGMSGRGIQSRIVFDLDNSMGESSCVGCGECVQVCPTGALSNRIQPSENAGEVNSVCPYCGVGCLLTYHVEDNKIFAVSGRDGPANKGRLCVKGRYGFDYVHHRQRLTRPLIRREGIPKGLNEYFDANDPTKIFREADWDEALDLAAQSLLDIKQHAGSRALAGFGSAKCSNEEAYLFQKLIRAGFSSNNVDHCTRLCHASSVAALLEGLGSGAVSNQVSDVEFADVIFVVGSNTTSNHPVAATFIKNAIRQGKKLVVIDPRRIELTQHAEYYLQFKPGSDVALFNAMLYTVIEEDLIDHDFIEQRTDGFKMICANVQNYSPESVTEICGIEAETIRVVARLYAQAPNAMIFWGMGVSQHIHGTDNVRCLIALCLLCGQIGRAGSGLHPLRGQNNVQGASDAGLIPMFYPNYQPVDDKSTRLRFEQLWGVSLDANRGLTVVEIIKQAQAGKIRGMYIMGENPAMSDPDLNQTRDALATLDHLVVQDIFLTETAAFADVVLPASAWPEKDGSVINTDRRVQRGRHVLQPPGDAREDLWIIEQMAKRMGLNWHYENVGEVYEEMRSVMPSIHGISWQRLSEQDSVTYPCSDHNDPGQGVVFTESFPTKNGRALLVPARLIPADELPDEDYPLVLITGRRLEHWHTGTMTRRSQVLDAIDPIARIDVNPQDLAERGLKDGELIRARSRRGEITAKARADAKLRRGDIFIPFCYHEAAANLLTNAALDPYGKIPEFKYCAAEISSDTTRT